MLTNTEHWKTVVQLLPLGHLSSSRTFLRSPVRWAGPAGSPGSAGQRPRSGRGEALPTGGGGGGGNRLREGPTGRARHLPQTAPLPAPGGRAQGSLAAYLGSRSRQTPPAGNRTARESERQQKASGDPQRPPTASSRSSGVRPRRDGSGRSRRWKGRVLARAQGGAKGKGRSHPRGPGRPEEGACRT